MTATDDLLDASDDWTDVRDRSLRNPVVRGAYDDCNNEARTTLALIAARVAAGKTSADVAVWLANYTGMSRRRALRWVRRYERGELGGNAPIWLIHAYARAVGVAVVVTVAAPEVAA